VPDEDGDVIEQGSRKALPFPSRRTLIAVAAAVAVAAGAAVAVARPWSQPQARTAFPDTCRLLPAATVARYVPGASKSGPVIFTSTSQTSGECVWSPSGGSPGQSLVLFADASATASGARHEFGASYSSGLGQWLLQGSTSETVSGLGDQARAFVTETPAPQPTTDPQPYPEVFLVVRSGVMVVMVNYVMAPYNAGHKPADAVVLANAVAIARAALGGFATAPTASPIVVAALPSGGLRYASPANACHLLAEAAVTRYLGSAARGSANRDDSGTQQPDTGCDWNAADGGSLSVSVTVFSPGADQQAQQGFQDDLASAVLGGTGTSETATGSRNVPAVGSYAGAVFETGNAGATVALFAWSGNAEITVTLLRTALIAPDGAELSAATAAARDVFTALPRS
jgi:hypothetical protein